MILNISGQPGHTHLIFAGSIFRRVDRIRKRAEFVRIQQHGARVQTRNFVVMLGSLCCTADRCSGQLPPLESQEVIPSKQEIAQLLEDQPLSQKSWPIWRQRFLDWYYDRFSRTLDMDEALRDFVKRTADENSNELPAKMRDDPVAWHLWASALFDHESPNAETIERIHARSDRALALDPKFAPAHITKAYAHVFQAMGLEPTRENREARDELLAAAEAQNQLALRLDKRSQVRFVRGIAKMTEEELLSL